MLMMILVVVVVDIIDVEDGIEEEVVVGGINK